LRLIFKRDNATPSSEAPHAGIVNADGTYNEKGEGGKFCFDAK